MQTSGPDCGTRESQLEADRQAQHQAYLQAYILLEAVQGEGHREALAEVAEAERRAQAAGWVDVCFLLQAARTVHSLARSPELAATAASVAELGAMADRMGEPTFVAVALGLRALFVAGKGDASGLLSDASRAVALLDDETLPGMSRCLAYVVAAGAFNTLSLWELVDELYEQALRLEGASDDALQTAAVAVNRVLIRLEWALTLVENGDYEAARHQFSRVIEAVPEALTHPLRPLWHANVLACRDIVTLLAADSGTELVAALAAVSASMSQYHHVLVKGGDIEALPQLEAAIALARSRTGEQVADSAGGEQLHSRLSFASGARSFPLWVRSQILSSDLEPEVADAQRDYAQAVSRMRWQSRTAVLAAARSQIAGERRKADHDRLRAAVQTDTLTGLQNRRVFDLWLRRGSDDPGGRTALLLIDLDGFKPINDTFGHHCGDEVLRRVGQLMRELSRADDLSIRHGGDEFALILRDEQLDETAAQARAVKLAAAIEDESWASIAQGLAVSASIGLACGSIGGNVDENGVLLDAVRLYRAADTALYESKRSGRAVTVAPTPETSGHL